MDSTPGSAYPSPQPEFIQCCRGYLQLFLTPDIDADDDGIPESVSFGVRFTTIPAMLSGIAETD